MPTTATHYKSKAEDYFSGARKAFVDALPQNSNARLLEIGCGNGDTAAYAMSTGKCGWSCGVELCPEPAGEAKRKLQNVIVGDVETLDLQGSLGNQPYDILIMSEVLEHLAYPGETLRKLARFLKVGAIVMAGSPNVSHFTVISMLLKGRWDMEPSGIMDRTHLRWFTPARFRAMFEESGYAVEHVGTANEFRSKARLLNALSFGKLEHLFMTQIYLRARRA
jgi:2-polyprenyl-3-methyl-5-hydroxy-6-metoxy-1,4-benzoquinol methylase